MKALVTGASGTLGANLCRRLLSEGWRVRALVRRPLDHPLLADKPLEKWQGDVTNAASLMGAAADCDVVFHVAGFISYAPRDRRKCFQVNVEGTRNVLRSAAKASVRRIVVTSSTAAVGMTGIGQPPLNESAAFERRFESNPYMATKHQAEREALEFSDAEVVAVNPATIFGAGDVHGNAADVFRRLAAGRLKWCPPGGTGAVSVSDCVDGHLRALERGEAGKRYILCSENVTFRELFATIADTLGAPAPRRRLPPWLYPGAYAAMRVHDAVLGWRDGVKLSRFVLDIGFQQRYFDSTRAKSELGWSPRQSLAEMVAEAAEFYREQSLLIQTRTASE